MKLKWYLSAMSGDPRKATPPYLTPETTPSGVIPRRINIPADETYLAVVNELLSRATFPELWEQRPGGMTPEAAAAIAGDMWETYLNPEPPFFDDAENADDDIQHDPEYKWYEKASDWVITAFLAVCFTPFAGLVYKTTIPRLRLAIRKRDVGAILRILVDAVEVLSVDTYAAAPNLEYIDIDLEALAGGGQHEIRIEHTGTANPNAVLDPVYGENLIEIVRGNVREFVPSTAIITNPEDSLRNVITAPVGVRGLAIKSEGGFIALQTWGDDGNTIAAVFPDHFAVNAPITLPEVIYDRYFNKIIGIGQIIELAEQKQALWIRPQGIDTLKISGGGLGFYGASEVAKPTITGSRSGNAALESLLSELATMGLIQDDTTT